MAEEKKVKEEKKPVAVGGETELKKELESPSGGYFFYGAEDYLKKHYAEKLREAALSDSALPEMNVSSFDEDNYSPTDLLEAIATPPLMGSYRFVSVTFSDLSFLKDGERDELLSVLGKLVEYPETVFLLNVAAGGFDPGRPPKTPSAQAVAFSEKLKLFDVPLQDAKRLVKWLLRHVKDYGMTAEPGAPEELIRLCGREMFRLSLEIGKACILEKSRGGDVLTVAAVRESAAQNPEESAFALTNAIMNGDRRTALETLGRALKRGESPYKLLGGVQRVVEELAVVSEYVKNGENAVTIASKMKMAPYKAELTVRAVKGVPQERILRVLSLCAETEYRMKTGVAVGAVPLELLVVEAAAPKKGGGTWKR